MLKTKKYKKKIKYKKAKSITKRIKINCEK